MKLLNQTHFKIRTYQNFQFSIPIFYQTPLTLLKASKI